MQRKKIICALLAFLLAVPPLSAGGMESGVAALETQSLQAVESLLPEQGSQYDAEVFQIALTAGTLSEKFSSIKSSYNITLGPDEESFSMIVTPSEAIAPPTMTIYVDEVQYGTLTIAAPSPAIAVNQGETKTVSLHTRASASGDLTYDDYEEYDYTFTVRRAAKDFSWTVGDVTQVNDVDVLPVTVSAEAGLELQTILLDMNFDPAKLQFYDKSTAAITDDIYAGSDFLLQPGFYSADRDSDGYFVVTHSSIDNNAGTLNLQFGQKTLEKGIFYSVETNKEQLFTLYFKVLGELTWDSFSCRSFGATQRYGTDFQNLSSPKILTILGLPAVPSYSVKLPNESYQGGTLTVIPKKTSYVAGEHLMLTATAKDNYQFTAWQAGTSGLDLSQAGMVAELTVTPDMDLSGVAPVFAKISNLPTSDGVDTDTPYKGEYLLTVNTASTAQTVPLNTTDSKSKLYETYGLSEEAAEPAPTAWESGTDENGLTTLEQPHDLLWDEEMPLQSLRANDLLMSASIETAEVGSQQIFWTRDLNSQTNPWSLKWFTLKAIGERYNLWFEIGNKMQVTDTQFEELGASFEDTLAKIYTSFGTIYDRDGNGKLDVLIYDIQDASALVEDESYYTGLVNPAELYGNINSKWPSCGNNKDIVHLDTYPTMGRNFNKPNLSTIKSSMAHETQHLVLGSSVKDKILAGATITDYVKMQPPDWINEGLSQSVEHMLFGTLTSRINTFNKKISSGYSLTNWGGAVEDYALSYLFLQYLRTQAGTTDIMRNFYTDYSGGYEATILRVIQEKILHFKNLTFGEIVTCFYAALMMQEKSGAYGFSDDKSFDTVRPQIYSGSTVTLPANAAVYQRINAAVIPTEQTDVTRLGLTPAPITLNVTTTAGGEVTIKPNKTSYSKGEYVTVTAIPDEGYEFVRWEDAVKSSEKTIALNIYRSININAVFKESMVTITVSKSEGGKIIVDSSSDEGEIIVDPSTISYQADDTVEITAPYGDTVKITAEANDGYSFERWIGDVPFADQNKQSVTLTLTQSISISAEFQKRTFVAPQTLWAGATVTKVTPATGGGLKIDSNQGSITIVPKQAGTTLSTNESIPDGTYTLKADGEHNGQQFRCWKIWEDKDDVAQTGSGSLESASIEAGARVVTENPFDCYLMEYTRVSPQYGTAATAEDGPKLIRIESQITGRTLIPVNGISQSFESNTQDYDLYLMPEETRVPLTVLSESDVVRLTATGKEVVTLERALLEEKWLYTWKQVGESEPLTLTLAAGQTSGTVVLKAYNEAGSVRTYSINLIRAEVPSVLLSKENGNIVANLSAGQISAVDLQLTLNESFVKRYTTSEALVAAVQQASGTSDGYEAKAGLNGNQLSVALYPKDGVSVTAQKQVVLFSNVTDSLFGIIKAIDTNYIMDIRFGVLYGTAMLENTHRLTGTIEAYNANKLPWILLDSMEDGVIWIEAKRVQSAKDALGLRQFAFEVVLKDGVTYDMTVKKTDHTRYVLENITLTHDVDLEPMRLYVGDIEKSLGDGESDGTINSFDADLLVSRLAGGENDYDLDGSFDADLLVSRLAGGENDYDLDGDGKLTVFDADLLMANFGRRDVSSVYVP